MPKRTDIKTVMLIGSGPIVIGQACEFDYSGTQACKALKEEGYRVVLVNSNPATIMTNVRTNVVVWLSRQNSVIFIESSLFGQFTNLHAFVQVLDAGNSNTITTFEPFVYHYFGAG